MSPTETPAYRLTADCIWNSFRNSRKRHLILTGARKSGKTTLLSRLSPAGFRLLGAASPRQYAETDSEWISIDEIGYPETVCPEYCDEILRLMEKKRLIAVVRTQTLPFLEELCRRDDVFLVDLDSPFGNPGCVIMASGLGRRFGDNKLMADFRGKPLLQWTLDATESIFRLRIVVTRHAAVRELCRRQNIDVIFHDLPYRSDTVRLGLQAILPDIDSCMFCPGDQPLLRWDTVASLALSAFHEKEGIWRTAFEDAVGSPVLFPAWAFPELLTLPEGKGGGFVLKNIPDRCTRHLSGTNMNLWISTRRKI